MSASDEAIEAEIVAKGLTAPRITNADIDRAIIQELYHVFPGTTVTICALVLRNGYLTIGHSACADPANFNIDIGKKLARERAREQIWGLEGYLLREKLWHRDHATRED